MRLNLALIAVVISATQLACSSSGNVPIGEQQNTQLKTGLDAYAASWDGYIEAYTFSDGTDRVRIAVSSDGTGTIRFGDDALFPPATDPNAKYPPDFPQVDYGSVLDCQMGAGRMPPQTPTVWTGFEFSLANLRLETERLRASAWSLEVFAGWCRLQTPHPEFEDQTSYSCAPTCGVSTDDTFSSSAADASTLVDTCYTWDSCPELNPNPPPATQPFLCETLFLCQFPVLTCSCDSNSCSLNTSQGTSDVLLDVALEDSQQTMTGTLVLGGTNYTVRLKRQ